MNNRKWDGSSAVDQAGFLTDSLAFPDSEDWNEYLISISQGKEAIGAPVYFFFHIGTCNLTGKSQLVNLDEIARIAKKYDLYVCVEGAADKATGTVEINRGLSTDRAKYIAKELLKRDVDKDHIKAVSLGGIQENTPDAASRRTRILLYYKK
jgi:outer membrane protein OmpA-like peptidoglycan-associated protein